MAGKLKKGVLFHEWSHETHKDKILKTCPECGAPCYLAEPDELGYQYNICTRVVDADDETLEHIPSLRPHKFFYKLHFPE